MAAALDRGPLSAADQALPLAAPGRWFVLAAFALVALAVAVALQLQEIHHFTTSVHGESELRVGWVHRHEVEYMRLREQWSKAADAPRFDATAARELMLHYDIWASRVATLDEDTPVRREALNAMPSFASTLADATGFIAAFDRAWAASPEPAARLAAMQRLAPQLAALAEPIHQLSLAAAAKAAVEQTARNEALSRHSRYAVGSTLFLALLVLLFAGLSLRQMRLLARRQAAQQRLARELAVARAAAERSSRAKSLFLANMSHEIRTPFQGLLGMLSMLRETGLDARQVDYLRTATASADHLLTVLNDVLDMSQLEAGRMQVVPQAVNVRALLHDVEALMRPQAQARELALHVDIDAAVPERARLDPTRVKQVLFNLVSNGIKFSERGTVDVQLAFATLESGKPRLLFSVTDTGPGIDAATLEKLFTRFERGDTVRPGAPGGTGLGLEISRGLARLMGGDIEVDSRVGVGSTFRFVVPFEAAAAEADGAAPRAAPDGHDTEPHAPALEVLVAEDNPINRQVLAALLTSVGHRSHFVPSGEEAVDAVQRHRFDLVLMDLHMPGIDGLEATRRIRALPDRAAATVPIVALTADAFDETRERCLLAGMNNFLGKPVGRDKLLALLRQLFGAGAGSDAHALGTAHALPIALEADAVPLLDAEAIERMRSSLGEATYGSMLADALQQCHAAATRLHEAMRDAQPTLLQRHAQGLHRTAHSLGLSALAATAEALDHGAARLPAHEVARLVRRFEERLAATRQATVDARLLHDPRPATTAPAGHDR